MQCIVSRRRRIVGAALAAGLAAALAAPQALAQAVWPDKPVKLLVGAPAGGPSDVMARLLAEKLGQALGQPVVVDNRPGAAGTLAAAVVAKAPGDGYTMLLASPTAITLAPTTMADRLPYSPAKDLLPVTQINRYPLILLATPQLGVKSVPELLAKARAQPGKINFASFGANSSGGLGTEQFKLMAKVDLLHVPFNGAAPMNQALLGGTVDVAFDTLPTALANARAGKLVPLAVTTTKRVPLAPELPTVAETVPGFEADSWTGFMMPAGTPPEVVARVQAEVARIVASEDMKQRFVAMGAEGVASTPADFKAFLDAETARYAKLVKEANLKLE